MTGKEYKKIKQHFKQVMRSMFKEEGLNCVTIDVSRGYKPTILFTFALSDGSYKAKYARFLTILKCHSDNVREHFYSRDGDRISVQFDNNEELYWLFNAMSDFHTKDSEGFELWSRLQ